MSLWLIQENKFYLVDSQNCKLTFEINVDAF